MINDFIITCEPLDDPLDAVLIHIARSAPGPAARRGHRPLRESTLLGKVYFGERISYLVLERFLEVLRSASP